MPYCAFSWVERDLCATDSQQWSLCLAHVRGVVSNPGKQWIDKFVFKTLKYFTHYSISSVLRQLSDFRIKLESSYGLKEIK